MDNIGTERRREIARTYRQLYRQHGEAAAIEQLGIEFTISPEEIREISAEFPDEE